MRSFKEKDKTDSYGFRFSDGPNHWVAGVKSIGWEETDSVSYDFQGEMRKDIGYLLQYTIAGYGMLQFGEDIHRIEPGEAFLVKLPSAHRYYFPNGSPGWEFIYMILFGSEVERCWSHIHDQFGPKIDIPAESTFIQLLWDVHRKAQAKKIDDGFQSASLGYQLIMELQRSMHKGGGPNQLPGPILKAIHYMQSHFSQNFGLIELEETSGVSKSHLTYLFREHTGISPISYLTQLRMEKAVQLLRTTQWTINEIAEQVGYANGNYFSKVFRRMLGVAPGEFRNKRTMASIDHFTIR